MKTNHSFFMAMLLAGSFAARGQTNQNAVAVVGDINGVHIQSYTYQESQDYLGNQHDDSIVTWQNGTGGSASFDFWSYNGIWPETISWSSNDWPNPLPPGQLWANLDNLYPQTNTDWTFSPGSGSGGAQISVAATSPLTGSSFTEQELVGMTLTTGGSAGSTGRNLFQIYVTAQTVISPMPPNPDHVPWWPGYTPMPVPYDQFTIGSLGNLGADGNLFVILPDNKDIDVTPRIRGSDYVNFVVHWQKYTPSIIANGTQLSPNAVNVTNCVGQKIVFQLQFNPSLPYGAVQATNYQWWLPPKYVNAKEWFQPDIGSVSNTANGTYYLTMCHPEQTVYSRSAYSIDWPYCTYYKQSSWPLPQPETGAWWISGGAKAVTCYPTLTFNNGQTVSLASVRGDFLVLKPTVFPIVTNDAPFGGQINIWDDAPWLDMTSNAMHFAVYISKTHPGSFGLTQLVDMYSQTGRAIPPFINWNSTDDAFWLDGSGEYYSPTVTLPNDLLTSTNRFDTPSEIRDAPGLALGVLYGFYDGQWQTYVRFTPTESGSIPVTLGRIDWSWDSVANTTNGIWQVTADSGSTPIFHDDDSFPVWTNVKPSPKDDN